jgi:hypothetical protein
MNKPEFTFGDLVSIAGYHPYLFVVDGYREEHYHYPNEDWSDLVYELHNVSTAEWLEADEDDLSLVAPADQAEEYLAENPVPAQIIIFGMEGVEMAKEERKPTARELSGREAEERKKARKEKAEQIDMLLDEMNDYRRLVAEFNDEEHKARVEYITLKLAELTE